jgi:glycosyltransferase involved in cell wall biosynthesis
MLFSVIILTKNEAANLQVCLSSLVDLKAEIFIVDSGSTDQTLEIARRANCHIVRHSWETYAKQLNWALDNLPITTPWTIRLDADEHLTPELISELSEVIPDTPSEVCGYRVKRRVLFMGRWIRHGGYYPTWLLRVWRTGLGTCEQLWMDEHIILSEGKVVNLKHDIVDENHKGLTFWTDKHNRYADREVKDMLGIQLGEGSNCRLLDTDFSQAGQRRWVKKNLYARSPLFLRAFVYWLLRYTVGLGFLDGIEGLIFHFLQGFWYRFLVDAKLYNLQRINRRTATAEPSPIELLD